MSTKAQITANRHNAQQSSGPKTETGKAVVSNNAHKHGARSDRLINAAEASAYEEAVNALNTQFSSGNPLIKFQIERIAKIKIQLERVQALIDSAFAEADLESSVNQYLISALNIDEAQRSELDDPKDPFEPEGIDIERLEIAQTILRSNVLLCQSHEEINKACPELGEYLIKKSQELNVSLGTYISYLINHASSSAGLKAQLAIKLRKIFENEDQYSRVDSISDIPYEQVISVANKLACFINDLSKMDLKVATFRLLQKSNQFSGQPNFEILNNLYRYQTTLQKQLSTTFGELLALDAKQH